MCYNIDVRRKHRIRSSVSATFQKKKKLIRFIRGQERHRQCACPSKCVFPLICTSAIYSGEPTNYVENGEEFASAAHATHARRGSAHIMRRKVVVRDNLSFSSPGSWPKAQEPDKKIATRRAKEKETPRITSVCRLKIADYDNGVLTIDIFGVVQYLHAIITCEMSRKKLSVFWYLVSRSLIAPIALRYKFDTFLLLLFAIRINDQKKTRHSKLSAIQ